MKEAEKIEVEQTAKKRGSKLKRNLGCLLVSLILLLICALIVALLWMAGYVQKYSCSLVVEDSQLWNQLECGKTSSPISGEFQYQQNNPNQETVISDQEQVIKNVVSKASPSVVAIGIKGNNFQEDQVIGTGFIVTQNGLIVTNRHVVSDTEVEYFVNLKDSTEPITVSKIYRDPVNDIALVKIEMSGLAPLPLGDSDKLVQGQSVVAIGNPLGKYSGTVTAGIISGLNREVTVGEGFFSSALETYEDVIQTDAAINPGNSGGPLLNSNAEVIGVNFATVNGADNLSFALPINRVKNRIEELNQYGYFRIPYVGIEYRLRIVFVNGKATVGAEVLRVVPQGPAEQAGFKRGDIIIQFNGSDLEETSLFSLIQKTKIGEEVVVGILRGEESLEKKITIAERGE